MKPFQLVSWTPLETHQEFTGGDYSNMMRYLTHGLMPFTPSLEPMHAIHQSWNSITTTNLRMDRSSNSTEQLEANF
jgi:hypothetical protein